MEEAIINPWWIYLFGIWDNIQFLLAITILISVLFGIMFYWMSAFFWYECKSKQKVIKYVKIFTIFFIPWVLFLSAFKTLLPDKEYIAAMFIANQITWESVEDIKNVGHDFKEEFKNDIIEILNSIEKEPKTDNGK